MQRFRIGAWIVDPETNRVQNGELRKAATFYRLVVDLQPEHRWAADNLALLGDVLNDVALYLEGLLARNRGTVGIEKVMDLRRIIWSTGNVESARTVRSQIDGLLPEPTLRESVSKLTKEADRTARLRALSVLWSFDAWSLWQERDYAGALAMIERISRRIAELDARGVDVARTGFASSLAALQIGMGRLAEGRTTRNRYLSDGSEGTQGWLPDMLLAFIAESPEPLRAHDPPPMKLFFGQMNGTDPRIDLTDCARPGPMERDTSIVRTLFLQI